MRICLNLLAAIAGGQLTRAQAFLQRFSEFAPDAELVVLKERSVPLEFGAHRRIEVIEVPIGIDGARAVRRTLWENLHLRRVLVSKNVDVYLTFSHYLPVAFPARIPSLVGISNLAPFSSLAWDAEAFTTRLRRRLLKRSILSSARRAGRVIALSDAGRQAMVAHGIDPAKVVTIPIGVDDASCERGDPAAVLGHHGIDRPYLLYVAHFYRYKNFSNLLDAFAALPKPLRDAHQLVLVGKPWDRGYYDSVVAHRDRLALGGQVLIVPGEYGERLRTLYRNARLFVFPSLIENCPNSLLEAMAAGTPVIASSIMPMPEFGGDAARYFDAHDAGDMAARIAQLLAAPAELDRMRAASLARAAVYSWDNFVMKVLAECRATLRRNR